jgi:hypothetical protein
MSASSSSSSSGSSSPTNVKAKKLTDIHLLREASSKGGTALPIDSLYERDLMMRHKIAQVRRRDLDQVLGDFRAGAVSYSNVTSNLLDSYEASDKNASGEARVATDSLFVDSARFKLSMAKHMDRIYRQRYLYEVASAEYRELEIRYEEHKEDRENVEPHYLFNRTANVNERISLVNTNIVRLQARLKQIRVEMRDRWLEEDDDDDEDEIIAYHGIIFRPYNTYDDGIVYAVQAETELRKAILKDALAMSNADNNSVFRKYAKKSERHEYMSELYMREAYRQEEHQHAQINAIDDKAPRSIIKYAEHAYDIIREGEPTGSLYLASVKNIVARVTNLVHEAMAMVRASALRFIGKGPYHDDSWPHAKKVRYAQMHRFNLALENVLEARHMAGFLRSSFIEIPGRHNREACI